MPNPFVHVELHTTEPIRAKQFYAALFGWKLTDVELASGTYTMIDVGNGTGGGMLMQTPTLRSLTNAARSGLLALELEPDFWTGDRSHEPRSIDYHV